MQKIGQLVLLPMLGVMVLLVSCNNRQNAATTRQSTQTTAPTASAQTTPAPLLPTPTVGFFEAANPLEGQVVETYEASRGSVVNITNRRYAVNTFLQAVPQ